MNELGALRGKKVFVGLSGGVDSSVTAALLKQAGAQVTGVFIKGWYPPGMPCTWAQDRRDAMRVAAHIGIPFHLLDASEEYKRGVIDYLLSEYKAGRTPNPDIMCNREVKFGAFAKFAASHTASIATGHYAQINRSSGDVHLMRGLDESKDQSYFLWAVPKDALSNTWFPVGGYEKSHVRTLADRLQLPVAHKRDSQGICFLGNISVGEFLTHEFENTPGGAVTASGEVVGTHSGVLLHTLGERIALLGAAPGPWYVIAKDVEQNTLVVSHSLVSAQEITRITLRETNWFALPTAGEVLIAQYRYHGARVEGTYDTKTNTFTPIRPIEEPIAGGQSLVLYRKNECMGGGIIS